MHVCDSRGYILEILFCSATNINDPDIKYQFFKLDIFWWCLRFTQSLTDIFVSCSCHNILFISFSMKNMIHTLTASIDLQYLQLFWKLFINIVMNSETSSAMREFVLVPAFLIMASDILRKYVFCLFRMNPLVKSSGQLQYYRWKSMSISYVSLQCSSLFLEKITDCFMELKECRDTFWYSNFNTLKEMSVFLLQLNDWQKYKWI